MRLLLDTHALLWWLDDSPRLGGTAHGAISEPGNEVFVSLISLWEFAIEIRVGKLKVDLAAVDDRIDAEGFVRLPLAMEHLRAVVPLPMHHRDPFDHLLIAQAQVEGLTFVTADRFAASYDVAVLACG